MFLLGKDLICFPILFIFVVINIANHKVVCFYVICNELSVDPEYHTKEGELNVRMLKSKLPFSQFLVFRIAGTRLKGTSLE
jgi:hypothetical protein